MGKFNGKILLKEKKVKEVLRELHKDERLAASTREQIRLIGRMSLWYIKMAERASQFHGQFEEYYITFAAWVCRHFGASDGDLREMFYVGPRTIDDWRASYPEFDQAISNAREDFKVYHAWNSQYRGWLHPYLAHALCAVLHATDEQIAYCFGIDLADFAVWLRGHPDLAAAIRHGRRTVLFEKTLLRFRQILESRLGSSVGASTIEHTLSEFAEVFEMLSVPAVADQHARLTMNEIYRIMEYEKAAAKQGSDSGDSQATRE